MDHLSIASQIKQVADSWLCDSYSSDIRFIAETTGSRRHRILSASITLSAIPHTGGKDFSVSAGGLFSGQQIKATVAKAKLAKLLEDAINGMIRVDGHTLELERDGALDFYSETTHRDQWLYKLHLRISGDRVAFQNNGGYTAIDNALRISEIPFDGLTDLTSWLGLPDPSIGSSSPAITITINPSVALVVDECRLSEGRLQLKLHAHSKLVTKRVGLSIRTVQSAGLPRRQQLGEKIKWSRSKNGMKVGTLDVEVEDARQVIAMLSLGEGTVQRHWVVDSTKAPNIRLLAIQQFDNDLRRVRKAVLEPFDQDKFELGVATILFLQGFTPIVQVATDSPDIVMTTPGGRLAIVECTMRIADFASKVGKLVDRREALVKTLVAKGHVHSILSVLVCALPRDQVSASDSELLRNKVVLLCKEYLSSALDRSLFPLNADQLLIDAESRFTNSQIFEPSS